MKNQIVIHPFLFALFPALFLFGTNARFFDFAAVLVPATVTVVVVALSWLALSASTRDRKTAAIAVSILVLALFSFQALTLAVDELVNAESNSQGLSVANQIVLGCLGVAILGAGLCFRIRKHLNEITYLLNVVGTILVAVPLSSFAIDRLVSGQMESMIPDRRPFEAALDRPLSYDKRPDIYYIVLDAYGRADYLRENYDFDNSGLIRYLEESGFYVTGQSRSNYPQTLLSIASSLNFAYLHDVLGTELGDFQDRRYVRELLRNSRTVHLLRKAGYAIVAFGSEFHEAEIGSPDLYLSKWWFPNLFDSGLINMTPVPWIMAKAGSPLLYDLHRTRILYSFDGLAKSSDIESRPKFVYSHIFAGHPPFVFDSTGGAINPDRPYSWSEGENAGDPEVALRHYRARYRDQVTFLNRKLQAALDGIIQNSEQPPIIIVQGDHGPGSKLSVTELDKTDVDERYSILNAYYLPGVDDKALYDSISPVNSFRVVFNHYFGTSFSLLPDNSYYTPFSRPYDFTLVESDRFSSRSDDAIDPSGAFTE